MHCSCEYFRRLLRGFARDESGVTAIFFGIFFSTVLLAGAIAIDFSRMVSQNSRDQRALDSAVLAASDQLGLENQQITGEARARAFYIANSDSDPNANIANVHLDADSGVVSGQSNVTWQATLLKVFGFDTENLSNTATAKKGTRSVEIAMVLDNSGSMSGSKISDLRTAATDLSNVIFAGASSLSRIKIGLVPFGASVNVGTHYAGASWIDGTGQSSIHFENFADQSRTRFDLFSDLGEAWQGCVEARPNNLDVLDTPAGSGDTLFVPMFAPDEPGTKNSSPFQRNDLNYRNSYLPDDGGTCEPYPKTCPEPLTSRGNCPVNETVADEDLLPNPQAQARMCKYQNTSVSNAGWLHGPNFLCSTNPILPLSTDLGTVTSAIDAMQAQGSTNIKEGIAWGWRVLSRALPFTEGEPNDTEGNRKILIVMTDGENQYIGDSSGYPTHNLSIYGAHGFAAQGRVGSSHSSSAYRANLDMKTLSVCSNAKDDGVIVYTVGFEIDHLPETVALLAQCASGPDQAFNASSGGDLVQAFRDIAKQISDLHISG